MPYHRVPDRREKPRPLASPFRCQDSTSTATPNIWGELPADQEGSLDRPPTPRVSGARSPSWDAGNYNEEPSSSGGWGYSTSKANGFNGDGKSERDQTIKNGHATQIRSTPPHRRMLKREDTVVGSDRSATPNDLDSTWEQCGLAGGKTASKSTYNATTAYNHGSNDESWGHGDSSLNHNPQAGQESWNRSVYHQESGPFAGQRPSTAEKKWRASHTYANVSVPVIPANGGPSPAHQTFIPQHGNEGRMQDSHVQGATHLPSERRFGSRVNPDNYDGNRAGPDGSRVFYSAILPSVPTLRDIANHAEYTAWLDMLKSVLKYHQLTVVISPESNRPHGYKEGRRWDQDRLRAAIIIKGALAFEVFERVRRNGWRDTDNPTETVEKLRETHGAMCPCGHSQGMTLLDL